MRPIAHPHPLGWKAECIETLRLAGPLAAANLLQMLTYAVDVMFIARLGPNELAASALAIAVFGILVASLNALVSAVSPLAAAELGARAPALRPIRRVVRMAMWLALGASLVAMVLCTQAEAIMLATGQDPVLSNLAGRYTDILLFSLAPMILAAVLRNFVSTLGRPVFATAITGMGVGVNALANYAFIFGNLGAPAMGLEGAAIATLISSLTILAAYIIAIRLDPRLHRYHVFGFVWRPDWQRLAELVRIGTPIGLTVMAEAGIFGAAALLMGRVGTEELAAHTLAIQLAALAFMVPMGVGQAGTIRVGYFYGARENVGIHRAGWAAIVMGTGFMGLTAIAILVVPEYILWLYLNPWEPENRAVVGHAVAFLVVCAAFQLFDGLQAVAAGALRGLKDTRVPMWIAIFSYWVPGFGTAAWLGLYTPLAGTGIWIGLAAGLICAAVLLLWRWHRRDALGLTASTI
ncbi:MATE family efflux transporter [Alteraurantiacibacter aquimixticola]|uniref:Multidrug-efflux transporter n=2 Tax=Alteraurantiacibacter aquimixticola TaxID=2489173 RepID=A0A4T3EZ68_9SPHN|nr:MATE family efflux transporter [Alteraurantiacibacter aquimixticola]